MAILISIQEVGSNVVVTGNGSANLTGLTKVVNASQAYASLRADAGFLILAPDTNPWNFDDYTGMTGPSTFGPGSGGTVFANTSTGNGLFGIYTVNTPRKLYLPVGYTSGTSLSGTSTYNSKTLASLGLTAGTYTWTWATDSLTVEIGISTIDVSVTQSIIQQPTDISTGTSTTYAISNPLSASAYFTLETVPNNQGFYTASSPKNTSGSFTLGSGLSGLVQSDYIASVVVAPGGGTLTFVPQTAITAATLKLRGIGA